MALRSSFRRGGMARNFGNIGTDRLAEVPVADAVSEPDPKRVDCELSRHGPGTLERIQTIVRAYQSKPVVDPRPGDTVLYDDWGLPK